ncbi:hypothetical protein FRAAL1178 [Frankia alni ACN14a]|uniref:Uncharacterized protein n=1 Tax=Frankia alni (strain DSM 45986 / CECT 9034 / ACN14a) TaxID=326424 RepID=Q0RRH9_FRAAA|nr:hypothetical protein FRAAL1178 [Frankia alni ACN14a]
MISIRARGGAWEPFALKVVPITPNTALSPRNNHADGRADRGTWGHRPAPVVPTASQARRDPIPGTPPRQRSRIP